jgi:DNA-binding IclR family transcriptional regulator
MDRRAFIAALGAAAAVPLMLPTGQRVAVLAVIAPRERFLARENRITAALLAGANSFHEYGSLNSPTG